MVYKRYIKKGGKKVGPYYYDSVRDSEGKVRTIYIGRDPTEYLREKAISKNNTTTPSSNSPSPVRKIPARPLGGYRRPKFDPKSIGLSLVLLALIAVALSSPLSDAPTGLVAAGQKVSTSWENVEFLQIAAGQREVSHSIVFRNNKPGVCKDGIFILSGNGEEVDFTLTDKIISGGECQEVLVHFTAGPEADIAAVLGLFEIDEINIASEYSIFYGLVISDGAGSSPAAATELADEQEMQDLQLESSQIVAGEDIVWTKKVKVQNTEKRSRTLEVSIDIPDGAKSVTFTSYAAPNEFSVSDTVEGQAVDYEYQLESLESEAFELEYVTDGPVVEESNLSEADGRLTKTLKVSSDYHYENVLTYATVPDLEPEQVHLFWIIDGVKTDVTERADFNLSFYDENGDGLIDKMSWVVPHLSTQEFIIVFDITVINPWHTGATGEDWIVYFNTTGEGTLNISKDSLADSVLSFNWIKCGIATLTPIIDGPSVIVYNYSCDYTGSISHTISEMPAEIFSQRFEFGNDLYNDVDFAYDPCTDEPNHPNDCDTSAYGGGPGVTCDMLTGLPSVFQNGTNCFSTGAPGSSQECTNMGPPFSVLCAVYTGGAKDPVATITASDATATEAGLTTGGFTITLDSAASGNLAISFTVSGNATAGTDYTSIGTSATVLNTEGNVVVTVTPLYDSRVDEAEIVTVTLASGTGYTVGSPSAATVTITNNDHKFILGTESTTSAYTVNGSANTTLSNSSNYSTDQIINFTHSTHGVRLALNVPFSTSLINLTTLVIDASYLKTAINFTSVSGPDSANHTIYFPLTGAGGYICPDANATSQVSSSCSKVVTFSHPEALSGTSKGGFQFYIEGSSYKIMNLSGSGAGGWDQPGHTTPLLNLTDNPNNTSSANLTAWNQSTNQNNSVAVYNNYDWIVNNTSIAVVNMAFDVNNSTGVNNYGNGSSGLVSGPTHMSNASCKRGGCYKFDGVDDFINISDSNSLDITQNISISFWLNITALPASYSTIILGKANTSTHWAGPYWFELYGTSNPSGKTLSFWIANASDQGSSINHVNSASLSYQHIVGTYDGKTMRLFVNGTQVSSKAISATLKTNAHPFYIGKGYGGSSYGGNYSDVVVDELTVYDRTLTAQQISAIYNSGTPKYNVTVAEELKRGEIWKVNVTPIDKYRSGPTKTSATVTIMNSVPTQASPILNATDDPLNRTDANLTAYNQSTNDVDNDTVINVFNWVVNESSITVLNMPFEIGNGTLNVAVQDWSGAERDGSIMGGALTWTTGGPANNFYNFGGTNEYVSIPYSADFSFAGASPFSLNLWLRTSATGKQGIFQVLDEAMEVGGGCGAGPLGAMYFLYQKAGPPSVAEFIICDDVAKDTITGINNIADGNWHMITLVKTAIDLNLYYDGSPDLIGIPHTQIDIPGKRASDPNSNQTIGRVKDTQTLAGTSYYDGDIDDVIVYNRALSVQQITKLYNAGSAKYDVMLSSETNEGDVWYVNITPIDLIANGTTNRSNNVSTGAVVTLTLSNCDVSFGNMIPGQADNTTDGSPAPCVVNNTGNVDVNLSVEKNASLFSTGDGSGSGATVNFGVMVANTSGSTACCVGTGSGGRCVGGNFSVINTSINEVVRNLSYIDGSDVCEIEYSVKIPSEEPPGLKNATVFVTGAKSG
ncbi:TPA: hypothetical protein H1008_03800 [archaeon]|nr:hypothetical protein [Candidatus Undinarchaeales archaeon SRR5007147.bin71]